MSDTGVGPKDAQEGTEGPKVDPQGNPLPRWAVGWCSKCHQPQDPGCTGPCQPTRSYPYDALLHVMHASTTAPSWAVLDWGMGSRPEARIVAMFYEQAEASEYSRWLRHTRPRGESQ